MIESGKSHEEYALARLANEIILQAVADWRFLVSKGATESFKTTNDETLRYEELRDFFKSDWCALLCGNVDPLFILDALEHERKAALNEI